MAEDPNQAAERKLKMARAEAIHRYAALEQALSDLFALLLGADPKLTGIVYFRIGAHQRNLALEQLLLAKFKKQYETYWRGSKGQPGQPKVSGMLTFIRGLDTIRNQIVHWNTAKSICDGEPEELLIPPNIWAFIDDLRQLTVAEIDQFSVRADFAARSINMFKIVNDPNMSVHLSAEKRESWLQIFQQPCVYPPSAGHPLATRT